MATPAPATLTRMVKGRPKGAWQVLTARLARPMVGAWHATVDAAADDDAETLQTGETVVLAMDGVQLRGTVIRAGVDGARHLGVRIVGGAGGLSKKLPAKNWAAGPTVRAVLTDLLAAAGEKLSKASDEEVLTKFVARWERDEELASRGIVALLDTVSAIWRVQADGTLWVGFEAYPEADVAHVLVDEDWAQGALELAPAAPGVEPALASLEPGVTLHGLEIRYVVHQLDGGKLRTQALVQSPGGALERFLAGVRQTVAYSRLYPARVVSQHADGTLELLPDDAKMRGNGVDRVPIRLGVPGSVTVPGGARVRFGFEAGDPRRPFVATFDSGMLTELRLGSGSDFIALAGPVSANEATILALVFSHVHTGVTSGAGTSGPAAGVPPSLAPVAAAKTKAD